MKKYISVILIFFLCLISCNSESGLLDIPEEKPSSQTYSFEKIEYFYSNNSEITLNRKILPPIIYKNTSSVEQTYLFDATKNMYESSVFESTDTRAFSLPSISHFIKTPTYLTEKDQIIIEDEARWSYTNQEQKQRSSSDIKEKIIIASSKRMILNPTLITKSLSLSYILTLKGNEQGEILEIRGRWISTLLIDNNLDIKFEDID